jgi:hypothetical protein
VNEEAIAGTGLQSQRKREREREKKHREINNKVSGIF